MTDTITTQEPDKKERELLSLMYEVQEKMEPLIEGGKEDPDFKSFERLIARLENYIQTNNQTLI